MSKKSDAVAEPMLVTEKLTQNVEFSDVLGATFLAGWSYTLTYEQVNESVVRATFLASKPGQDPGAKNAASDIQMVWELAGGEWFCDRENTGYVRYADSGVKITPKTFDLMITYLGKHFPDWVMTDFEDPKPTRKPRKQKAIGDGKTQHEPDADDTADDTPATGLVDEETVEE